MNCKAVEICGRGVSSRPKRISSKDDAHKNRCIYIYIQYNGTLEAKNKIGPLKGIQNKIILIVFPLDTGRRFNSYHSGFMLLF